MAYDSRPEDFDGDYPNYQDTRNEAWPQGDGGAAENPRPALNYGGPAHPLPNVRRSRVDYDQYLEAPTAKFQIFSAENSRKRRKSLVRGAIIGAIVLGIVIWVMFGRA